MSSLLVTAFIIGCEPPEGYSTRMATARALADGPIDELGEEWKSTRALVHRLQRERGVTCSWVAARAAGASLSIMKTMETRYVVADFRKRTSNCLAALSKPRFGIREELRVIREQADANTASARSDDSQGLCKHPVEQARRFAAIFLAYTSLIQALLDEFSAKSGKRCSHALLAVPKWCASRVASRATPAATAARGHHLTMV
jgi:hypothetical protein